MNIPRHYKHQNILQADRYNFHWFVSEQNLIKFNQPSGDIEFTLSGQNACIKLPGAGSTITTFKLYGGMGYLDVDLAHWTKSTETINNITYQVWTKNDPYILNTSHKINFKLKL